VKLFDKLEPVEMPNIDSIVFLKKEFPDLIKEAKNT